MFIPSVGGFLTVSLPGESLRAQVDRVINRNTVLVTLPQPLAKSHSYRRGDMVACRRTPCLEFGNETWSAIEHRPEPPQIPTEPDPPQKRKGKR